MRQSVDVTKEYLTNAVPNSGSIIYEDGYKLKEHDDEISMANFIENSFGGDICLLAEASGSYGVKRSDYLWNGRLWELKTVGSAKAVDKALRKAISQIYDNPGGVILEFRKTDSNIKSIEGAIKSRIETSCRFKIDVMVIVNGKFVKALRYT